MLAIILHAIINADIMFRKGEGIRPEVRTKYRLFLYAVLLFYASDICWGIFISLKMTTLAYINTIAFFFSMALTVFLWVKYIRFFLNQKNIWSSILNYATWTLFVAQVVVLVLNIFTPIMFTITVEGEYITTNARSIVLDVQILLYSIVGVYTLIRAASLKDRDRTHHIAVGLSGLLMAFFILLQARYPMTPFYSMGLLIATSVMHTFVLVDERIESSRKLGSVRRAAYKDPLTNVRNANAYSEAKAAYDKKLKDGQIANFGVVVFDLNNLKTVNDTQGHEAGDKYIQDSCKLICSVFKHSPVYRIGGDEFVAILTNEDYINRDSLLAQFNQRIDQNQINAGPVVAAGMSLFVAEKDSCYEKVFERADVMMYARKKELKQKAVPVTP